MLRVSYVFNFKCLKAWRVSSLHYIKLLSSVKRFIFLCQCKCQKLSLIVSVCNNYGSSQIRRLKQAFNNMLTFLNRDP